MFTYKLHVCVFGLRHQTAPWGEGIWMQKARLRCEKRIEYAECRTVPKKHTLKEIPEGEFLPKKPPRYVLIAKAAFALFIF